MWAKILYYVGFYSIRGQGPLIVALLLVICLRIGPTGPYIKAKCHYYRAFGPIIRVKIPL